MSLFTSGAAVGLHNHDNLGSSEVSSSLGALPVWDLSDLYGGMDDPQVERDLSFCQQEAAALEAEGKGQLAGWLGDTTGIERLAVFLERYEALSDTMGRLGSFASLVAAWDHADPKRLKFQGDVYERLNKAGTHLIFLELELNRVADDRVQAAIALHATLQRLKPWLEDIRREKPYQLEDRVEQLFFEKHQTSNQAWNRLFDETLSRLRFDVGGQTLTLEPTLNLMQDRDPAKREAAFYALAKTFGAETKVFALILNTLAKDKEIADRWRGFPDIAASRHLANRIEGEVVDALVDAVRASYGRVSHRYYTLKAKWFGKEALDSWDRNAPLPDVPMPTLSWSQAVDVVMEAYRDFHPRLHELAQPFFGSGWIDAPVRPGKSSGAFAHPTVPSAHPYLLVNYMGKPRDVMTLAHELGHGVHQRLAAQQGPLMAPTPLTLAETASVFGEMLTFRRFLRDTTDPHQRKALLASKVEDMINTAMRQIAFYSFERAFHTARREGELTAEAISALWMQVQGESLGDGVRLNAGYEHFWVYISHFVHSPFYVYAYAFGDGLVNALYAVYEKQPEGFADHYFALLEAGGSRPYRELLEPFGLNPADPTFWQAGLGLISSFIDELEAMEV
jgi:oligoendopeptidase F